MAKRPTKGPKQVASLRHEKAKRKNIPTAELQSAAQRAEEMNPVEPVTYPRQNPLPKGTTRPRDEDLDPQIVWKGTTLHLKPEQLAELNKTGKLELGDAQLVWRGKDQQDWSDLVVQAPPLYIQDKVHPKVLIDDLMRRTRENAPAAEETLDLFGDFNGIDPEAKAEFYAHDQNWSNRMILGDSLQVMASLAEREGLRGKIQCIYFDPPYGIKFNSNWQVSTRSRDVKDGKLEQVTREPEQVKAFRDTWNDKIHSYLTYLRDRFTAMRDLMAESGSIFVQIGEENMHLVRSLLDEIFGSENFCNLITFQKTGGQTPKLLPRVADYIIWFSKNKEKVKYRQLYSDKASDLSLISQYPYLEESQSGEFRRLTKKETSGQSSIPEGWRVFRYVPLNSQHFHAERSKPYKYRGKSFLPGADRQWAVSHESVKKLEKMNRLIAGGNSLYYKYYLEDMPIIPIRSQDFLFPLLILSNYLKSL